MSELTLKSNKPKEYNLSITRAILKGNYAKAELYLKRGDTIPYTFLNDCFCFGQLKPIVWGIKNKAMIADREYENLFALAWPNQAEQKQAQQYFFDYLKEQGKTIPFISDFLTSASGTVKQNKNLIENLKKSIETSKLSEINFINDLNMVVDRTFEVISENEEWFGKLSKEQEQVKSIIVNMHESNKKDFKMQLKKLDSSMQPNMDYNEMWKPMSYDVVFSYYNYHKPSPPKVKTI